MLIEIKHRFSGAVLFSHDCEGNTVKITVEAAVQAGANLADARLVGARLVGASLFRASLDGANLYGANLEGTNLADARLVGANLDDANLARANLNGANLNGARLNGANLADAISVIDAGVPDGFRCVAWFSGTIQLRVSCRNKTLTEGREYWAGKENRREVMAALDYIEAVAKIRGWQWPI